MVTLANTEIREAAKRNGVRLWQVAEGIGISDAAFYGICETALFQLNAVCHSLRDYAADGGRLLRYAPNGYTAAYAAYYITDDQLLVPEIMGNDAHAALLMEHLAAMAQGRKLIIKTFRGPVPDGCTAKISPWGAMAALNAPALMREVCGFDDISAEITDPIIPENNGIFTFSGAVAPSAHIKLDAGRLTQLLVG